MRILITGGAGFIGSWIANYFVENTKHDILVVDDLSTGTVRNLLSLNNRQFKTMDIRNESDVKHLMEAYQPEVIYHLAANAREGASFFQPISVTSRNIQGYINVLTWGIKFGMKKIVTFSSIAVYGKGSPPFRETDPKAPVDIYGLNKAMMEDVTRLLAEVHGFKYIIFRPFNVYGEHQSIDDKFRNVIGIWMNQMMRDEPVTIYGDGEQQRSFTYIRNVVPAFVQALDYPDSSIFNIGGQYPVTVNTLLGIVSAMMGASPKVNYLDDRHNEVKVAYCDNMKSVLKLNYSENYLLEDGIRNMARWAKTRGPQQWKSTDRLEIINELTPQNWLE